MTYGSKTALTISLNDLANGASVTSDTLNNTSLKYSDLVFQLEYKYASNPTAGNVLLISILGSLDGSTFDNVTPFAVLSISLTADTSSHYVSFFLNSLCYGTIPFPYFKISVTNNGGQALASAGNSLNYIGVNY